MSSLRTAALCIAMVVAAHPAHAQRRGGAALHELVPALTVTTRVLIVGAHPDDDDAALIAWLARGQHVETAYFSLTRGEAGQNLLGAEGGESIGAIRTQETLAARRIDGARQYFGRAYDVGVVRNAADAWKRWDHDTLLADMVRVVRSFRPHIVIAVSNDLLDALDGRHRVAALLAREAYALAGDTVVFPVGSHGVPWTPLKFYRHGTALMIDVEGYDAVAGRTYAEIAADSRAQHRSQGFANGAPRRVDRVSVERLASRVNDSVPATDERSLFDGIDTTVAGLASRAPPVVAPLLRAFAAYADSAGHALDLERPQSVVRHLGRALQIALSMRAAAPWCKRPAIDASPPAAQGGSCRGAWIEVDAAIDVMRRRAADALVAAAGLSVVATADRELLAKGEMLAVNIDVSNNGADSVSLVDARVSGEMSHRFDGITLAPGRSARASRVVIGLATARAWWTGQREKDMFSSDDAQVDGMMVDDKIPGFLAVPGVAVPEELRRTSDVVVWMRIANMTLPLSAGPVVVRSADAATGVQDRPVGGVPVVTLAFERPLEWIQANKPLDRVLHLIVTSFSDTTRTLSLEDRSPPGVRLDSLPASITLAPHEQVDVFLRLRGMAKPGRHSFGVIGTDRAGGPPLAAGFRTVQYPQLPPIRMYHSSGVWLAAVDVELPRTLRVGYIAAPGDAVAPHLWRLGIPTSMIDPDALPTVNLTQFSTIVIGARAYEANRSLIVHNARLLDFVRKGGTMVVQGGQPAAATMGVLPYPVTINAHMNPDRVTDAAAPVQVTNPNSRLLTWPNRIVDDDWKGWNAGRADYMPSSVDAHYATLLEMHDAGQEENRNAIVVTALGKGAFVYTSLSLHRQIPNGVLGSMRLFVNLLSAGIAPASGSVRSPSRH